MNRILKFLGFDPAAERTRRLRKKRKTFVDDMDDYDEDDIPAVQKDPSHSYSDAGIIFFKGLATDDDKLQLRDALLDGNIVIIDLGGISIEQKEAGLQFITFMSGVAFANKGEFLKLGPTLFSVSPRMGMVQTVMGSTQQSVKND